MINPGSSQPEPVATVVAGHFDAMMISLSALVLLIVL